MDSIDWKARISVVRIKRGRTLTTGILHVEGVDAPSPQTLVDAVNDWRAGAVGQVVRRPDESGRQVYWVNVLP
jgi:hypothetical protein